MYDPEAELMLYPGDVNDLLRSVPDGVVKLIVTSPPYNVGKEYEVRTSINNYLDQQSATIQELYRVLRDDGSICWQIENYVDDGEIWQTGCQVESPTLSSLSGIWSIGE